jgi:xanthine dehydrogenase accessory factor
VIDDRPEFANSARFPDADVICEDVPTAIARVPYGWQTYLIIATRGHKLDAACVRAAVNADAPYVGLLGSGRKKALIADMLREEGVPASRIDAVRVPVGLDLGGRTPEEIALAVLAEIILTRHGGSGAPLMRESARHAEDATTPA